MRAHINGSTERDSVAISLDLDVRTERCIVLINGAPAYGQNGCVPIDVINGDDSSLRSRNFAVRGVRCFHVSV